MSGPTVSVIIPTYNYGRFVADAVGSVLEQTYPNLEVIVIDDGSTDDTRERLKPFADRIVYISQANEGEAAARNSGIRRSSGEFVAFLDADDMWLPHKVERSVQILTQDLETSVVYTWRSLMDEAGSHLPQVFAPTHEGDVLAPLLLGCFIVPSMVMVRRVCLDHVGLFDGTAVRAIDYDLFLRIAQAGFRFRCVREALVRYRLQDTSVSSDAAKTCESHRLVLDRAFGAPNLPAELRRDSFRATAYRVLLVKAGTYCFWRGHHDEGRALLTEGVRLEPAVLGRPGFYIALAMAVIPVGYQTRSELLARTDLVAGTLSDLLRSVFTSPGLPQEMARRERTAWAALYLGLSVLYGLGGRWQDAASCLARSFAAHPSVLPSAVSRGMRGHWRAVRTTLQI